VISTLRAGRRVLVGSLAVLFIGGLGFWLLANHHIGSGSSNLAARENKALRVPDPLQVANFELLHTNPEGVPAEITDLVRQHPPRFGLNWSLAQRLPVRLRAPFWVVPGKETLCLTTRDETRMIRLSCQPTRDAIKHGVATITIEGVSQPGKGIGVRHIVGLAPNGASRVVIQTGKSRQVVLVRNHVFVESDAASLPPTEMTVR
jgi:hypothetical protein